MHHPRGGGGDINMRHPERVDINKRHPWREGWRTEIEVASATHLRHPGRVEMVRVPLLV